MRRFTAACLIALVLLLSVAFLASGLSSAQEPTPPASKGSASVPPNPQSQPATSTLQIDRALLPKIEPQLLKKLLQAEGDSVPFVVYLKARADLSTAAASTPLTAQGEPDFVAKRTAIINTLQQTAQNSQTGVLQALNGASAGGGVSGQSIAAGDIRSLWIVNAVAARGNLAMVLDLAARSDVAIVRLDKEVKLNHPHIAELPAAIPNPQSPEWGVTKIRADLVQNALGINGSGIVVANIDTGVDWQHAALQTQYRGYTGPGKLPQHAGNWYDTTGSGAAYPVDGTGHGTHTMGIMVGGNGVGVAPGARWIAVKAFDSSGSAQSSWLHEAFQWILAPNGNPALAPQVVNNSWGNNNGANPEFEPDVQALLDAGIYPVFSAGNNGPDGGTVGSPGSFNISFSVGATTSDDEIALFSSRGPSPWGQIKPEVSAPGKDVISTIPGGAYGSSSGTSMAAPHVSGLVALLLQASPSLANDLSAISRVITSTAVQLGSSIPNNQYGWGRIDAYNAVTSVASVGTLNGAVTQAGNGQPINNAAIKITPHAGGPTVNTTSDAIGNYLQGLAANTYDVTVSAFGYQSVTEFNITVANNAATVRNFSLTLQPTGTLAGSVRDKNTNAPLLATITIDGTPATISTQPANGSYSLNLPVGTYNVTVVAAQHRTAKAVNITINKGATVTRNFLLDSAPSILLVDSGKWYQESEIGYYQQALDDLLYPYDIWQIAAPTSTPSDVPTAATLLNYDVVIWSAPEDSPGYVQASHVITQYLKGGGRFLLSGQDIAFYDGGAFQLSGDDYLRDYFKSSFVTEKSEYGPLTGTSDGPFAGLSLTISGGDGADNQILPDVIVNTDTDFAHPALNYEGDELAGLHVGVCVPYRAMFLPFGFEAINSRADRQAVMERALNWLLESQASYGVELTPAEETRIGDFGAVVSHTVRVRNTGLNDDVYTLSLSPGAPYNWPVNPAPPGSLAIPSCQTQVITFGVKVNTTNQWHISDTRTLAAQSNQSPTQTATVTRTTKSPAPILLVDDDRFFSFAAEFKEALENNDLPYDYWLVPKSTNGAEPLSPPLETLAMYPMTVWYVAFDWYQPLTEAEENRLAAYLDGGGRLLFSGQDYIYNLPDHKPSAFAQTYLGVLDHTEDFSSTLIIGEPNHPVGTRLGPYPLTFPSGYKNWTDALTPTTTAKIATRGQAKQPNGISHTGLGPTGDAWRTLFLAYGPELLSSGDRARLMQRSVGWLSWLGSSTLTASTAATLDGTVITYTAIITNDGWHDLNTAYFTATFPSELTIDTFSSELTPAGAELIWNGPLARNQRKVFTYTATIADSLPLGTLIDQTSWLAYPAHKVRFDRVATTRVNFPDLSSSTMNVTPAQDIDKNDILTYTIVLRNNGVADAPLVTTTNSLPHMLEPVSVDTPSQGTAISGNRSLTWTTPLSKNGVATLTFRAVISYESGLAIVNRAYVDDKFDEPLDLSAKTYFKVFPAYLPMIYKN